MMVLVVTLAAVVQATVAILIMTLAGAGRVIRNPIRKVINLVTIALMGMTLNTAVGMMVMCKQ